MKEVIFRIARMVFIAAIVAIIIVPIFDRMYHKAYYGINGSYIMKKLGE